MKVWEDLCELGTGSCCWAKSLRWTVGIARFGLLLTHHLACGHLFAEMLI